MAKEPIRKRTRLSDLEALEVSLVPRGANRKKFLVAKEGTPRDALFELIDTPADGEGCLALEKADTPNDTELVQEAGKVVARILKAGILSATDLTSVINFAFEKGDPMKLSELMKQKGVTAEKAGIPKELFEELMGGKEPGDEDMKKLAKAMGMPLDELTKMVAKEEEDVEKGKRLGDFLRSEMEKKGLTAAQLGQAAGISESTVGQILRGEIDRPPDNRLAGFARALKISRSQLEGLVEKQALDEIFNEGSQGGKKMLTAKLDANVLKEDGSIDVDAVPDELKAFATAVNKSVENIRKSHEDVVKENKDLKESVTKLHDDKQRSVFVKKASDDFSCLGDPEKLGPILKSVHDKCTEEEWKGIEEVFKSVQAVAEKSDKIFKSIGRGGGGGSEGNDAAERLDAKVRAVMKEDKDLTYGDAYSQVCKEDPDLAAEASQDETVHVGRG